MTEKTEKYNAELWEDLVVSILSVNNYKIETTYKLIESLRNEGLLTPSNLIKWNNDTISKKLIDAGYDRGAFLTPLFASRLISLGFLIEKQTIEYCERVLLSNDKKHIADFLLQVNGIGLKVVDNFFILRS